MKHEQLWAPWRLEYIQAGDERKAPLPLHAPHRGETDCFLCRDAAETPSAANLVVRRGASTITVLNRYPYNNGHLLIAPAAHKSRLDELLAEEHLEVAQTMGRMVVVLEQVIRAEGFNIGLNLGRIAGAGLPGHLHWHVVPRWNGDTNFMPVTAGIKVIPQSLEALWQALNDALSAV